MTREPDFDSLFHNTYLSDRRRLRRTHELLLRAGPLPELPPSLRRPPQVGVHRLRPVSAPARRWPRRLIAPLAAAAVLTVTASAYLAMGHADSTRAGIVMHATAAAPQASAIVTVGTRDGSGNSPVTLHERGLPVLPPGSYYEMYLTDHGRLVGNCGGFRTNGGPMVVKLNVPYKLDEYSGWLIRRENANQPASPPLLTT